MLLDVGGKKICPTKWQTRVAESVSILLYHPHVRHVACRTFFTMFYTINKKIDIKLYN